MIESLAHNINKCESDNSAGVLIHVTISFFYLWLLIYFLIYLINDIIINYVQPMTPQSFL